MQGDNQTTDGSPTDAGMAPPPPPPPPPPPVRAPRQRVIGSRAATAAVAGGLVAGGIAGGYVISHAATATPSASASPTAGSGSAAAPDEHGFAGAGPAARAQDLQQVASVIGISTTQLQSETTAGKTIAAIAQEHNVAVATVISRLVADENAEIDAAVASGQFTRAQATQMKAMTTQRVTDLVNRTGAAGIGCGPRGGPAPGAAEGGSPST